MASYAYDRDSDDSDDELPDLEGMGDDDEEDEDEDEDSDEEEESEDEPETPETFKERGNEFYKLKNYTKAIESYSTAVDLAAAQGAPVPTYFLNRASAYMMKLMYKEAAADCDAALALDDGNAKAFFRKGKALLAGGKPQEAGAAFTAGLVKDPSNAGAKADRKTAEEVSQRLALAKQCLGKKEYVQVWKQLQMVEKHMSGGPDLLMMKVEAMCCIGKHQEAYTLSTQLMRSHPKGLEGLLFWRSKCLYYMDQVAPAIKHLQEAMRNDPDNSVYRVELKKWRAMEAQKEAGNEHFKRGGFAEAIGAWGECLTMDPNHKSYNAKLHLNRGTAHAKLRKFDEAVDDCSKAIGLDSTYVKAYNKRAECLTLLGEKEHLTRALQDLQQAAELDSDEEKRKYQQKIRETQVLLKRAGQDDLYKIMGAPRSADEGELKKLYRKAALKWHPDRWSNKPEEEQQKAQLQFQNLNRAFEVLGDPVKRKKYDSGVEEADLDNPHAGHSHGGGGGMGGMSPEMMHMFMRQHMGGH